MIADSMLSEQELDDISRRAHAFYAEYVQATLEPAHNGEFVALHVDAADYAIGPTSSRARFALRQRYPSGTIVTTRIGPTEGDPLAYRILASQPKNPVYRTITGVAVVFGRRTATSPGVA